MTPRRAMFRRAGLVLLFATGSVVLALGFVAFVPPLRTVRRAEWPAVPQVPPAENAWQPYLAALVDLAREPPPEWIITGTDAPALTPDQIAYLDRHPQALQSLHEGTQRQ